jgi:hypothetical protein
MFLRASSLPDRRRRSLQRWCHSLEHGSVRAARAILARLMRGLRESAAGASHPGECRHVEVTADPELRSANAPCEVL